jgi:hypothetical protein
VVYGEVATSLLYVYKSAFAVGDIEHTEGSDEICGVLSLVFWTLTLITLLKYITTGKYGIFLGFFIFLDTEEYNGTKFLST